MPRKIGSHDSGFTDLRPQKPYKFRRWKNETPTGYAHFFTCARPGRSGDVASRSRPVPDELVHRWVRGLPGKDWTIVSLLGRKVRPGGDSEFKFYTFCGGFDTPTEREGRPTLQEWLDRHHEDLGIMVREHPTYDFGGENTFPAGTLDDVSVDIRQLVSMGRSVVLMDSGGETRTGMVCRHMDAKEDSSNVI